VLLATAHRLDRPVRCFAAATAACLLVLLPVVAAFASRYAVRIEERNMFYAAPLLFVALAAWIERGLPRPRRVAVPAVAVAAALPALVPFERFIDVSAQADTLALVAWWDVHERTGISLDRLWLIVLAWGAALGATALLVPRRWAVALPAVVLVLYALALHPIEAGPHGVRRAALGALYQGITVPERDWIDRAVGADARVDAIWSGRGDRLIVNENEFFSRSVGRVFYLREPTPGGLAETPLVDDPATGALRTPDGSAVRSQYAFGDRGLDVAGAIVAQDVRKGTAVVRVDNPLRRRSRVDGVYDDSWSGAEVTYTRFECTGGTLDVLVASDARLFDRDQTLRASSGGRDAGRARIPRDGRSASLRVPLRRGRSGDCVVTFRVEPTAVPGNGDPRRLGTHFLEFRFRR
jgi:hypothetical protein